MQVTVVLLLGAALPFCEKEVPSRTNTVEFPSSVVLLVGADCLVIRLL